MCLSGNEVKMIETLQALNDARLALVQWKTELGCDRSVLLTFDEGAALFERRIATLEAKCRQLGAHGPAPKADPGEQLRILAQR